MPVITRKRKYLEEVSQEDTSIRKKRNTKEDTKEKEDKKEKKENKKQEKKETTKKTTKTKENTTTKNEKKTTKKKQKEPLKKKTTKTKNDSDSDSEYNPSKDKDYYDDEDELYEDELYEDELYDDELYEDELYEDEQKNDLRHMNIILGMFGGGKGGMSNESSVESKIKEKIKKSLMSNELKQKLYKKLEKGINSEKMESWFNDFLSIPFGKFSKPNIDLKKSSTNDIIKYFKDLMKELDDTVDGLTHVKEEIVNFVAQAIANNKPSPRIIALHGVPGTGKTKIIRDGVAKSLNTPMQTFSMGGVKDSSHFLGFDYTYQNSKYGAITQALMDSGVMNPVFLLDELDKISDTSEGEEIQNLLVHLTDPLQNHDFKDKYFDSLPIDLSRVFWIVIFNDISKLSPILKDRLHIIEIPPPTKTEKINIAKNFLIKEVSLKNNLNEKDFIITPDAIKIIVEKFSSKGEGVRTIKRCIETILLKVNTLKLLGKSSKEIKLSFSLEDTSLPIKVDDKNLCKFLDIKEKDNDNISYMMYM